MVNAIHDLAHKDGLNWTLINPPVIFEYDGINPLQKTWGSGINLGLVQCAKTLRSLGREVVIVDLASHKDIDALDCALKQLPTSDVYAITNNFYTTFMSTKWIVSRLLTIHKTSNIVLGGSHVGYLEEYPFADINRVTICKGSFEDAISSCDSFHGSNPIELWPKTEDTYYVLEVTRGCPYKCEYCHRYSFNKRCLADVNSDLQWFNKYWHNDHLVYACYNFGQVKDYEVEVLKSIRDIGVRFTTQGRADTIVRNGKSFLKLAADAGLCNLSIGFETIREDALISIGKTKKPREWIECTEILFQWCQELGIAIKLNLLLLEGETKTTINDLKYYLMRNQNFISGVSCSPLLDFPGTPSYGKKSRYKNIGQGLDAYYNDRCVFPLAISEEFDFIEAVKLSEDIESLFPKWGNQIWTRPSDKLTLN